ncbi:MAG: hypothetical protein H0U16_06970 [Actinobacteria bacterium]|nr:hypothetical protein [Actinomycetota bacterium]
MYARVTPVEGSPEKIDDGIKAFKEKVVPAVQDVSGYKGALLMVDRSSGKGIGMSLWESEEARRAGGEAVAKARESTIQTMGGTVPPVQEYEVVVSDLK